MSPIMDEAPASSLRRSIYPSLWLVMTLAAVGWTGGNAAALTLMLPLLSLSLLGGYRCHQQIKRSAQVMRWLMVILGCMIALPLLLRSRLLMGMLIFIFFMLLALGFTLRQRREVYIMLLGSLGMILYSASYAPARLFNWLIPLWVLAVVLVMMQLNGASGSLRHAGMRQVSHRGSFMAVVPVALSILLLAWLLHGLLPRPDALNFSLFDADEGLIYDDDSWAAQARERQVGAQEGEGQSEAGVGTGQFSPRGDSGLSQVPQLGTGHTEPSPPRLLLQVESEVPVLLRGLVFDHYDAGFWRRSDGADRYHRLAAERFERSALAGERVLRQQIEVMAEMDGVIPHLPAAQRIELPSRVLREDHLGNLYLPDRLQSGVRYTVYSVLDHIAGRLLYPGLQSDALTGYLQLPLGHEQLCVLAAEQTEGREPLAAAQQLEQYLINQVPAVDQPASRGLTEALGLGMTPLQRLSTFVLMQRCLGTPSRIVSGYQSSLQHPLSGRYQVSSEDATLWAEVWLEQQGWLRFVVNPVDTPTVAEGWLEQTRDYIQQRLEHADVTFGEWLGLHLALWLVKGMIALRDLGQSAPLLSSLLSILLLGCFVMLWQRRHRLVFYWLQVRLTSRLRRHPEQASIWLFAALEAWYTHLGRPRQQHETARQYLQRLQQYNLIPSEGAQLLQAFQLQRYGPEDRSRSFTNTREALQFWKRLDLLARIKINKS